MSVAQILKKKGNKVFSVASNDKILHALEILRENRIGAVLVMEANDKIVGVLSERDVVWALPENGPALLEKPVSFLMTRSVVTCTPDYTVEEILALMTRRRFRHVPVLEDSKLVGIISIGDAVKERISDLEHEEEALKEYIVGG